MTSNFCKAPNLLGGNQLLMIEGDHFTGEPTVFLSHLPPFLKIFCLMILPFLRTLKEHISHCAQCSFFSITSAKMP